MLQTLIVAVPTAFVLGLIAVSLSRRARARLERSVRRAGEALVPHGPRRRVVGRLRRGHRRPRRPSTGCCEPRPDATLTPLVRDREQPSRSAGAPWDRLRPSRAGDEDPQQVPPLARGRAVRRAPVADLRQGLPAHLCGVPRPRRTALRRRVQLALRRRDEHDAGPAPLLGAAAERRNRRLEAGSCCWRSSPSSVVTLVVDGGLEVVGRRASAQRRRRRRPRKHVHDAAGYLCRSRRSPARSSVAVTASSARHGAGLPGDGRARARRAVQGQVLLGQRQLAREPPHHGRRQAGHARRRQAARDHGDAERGGGPAEQSRGVDRRHGLRARARRPQRSQRPVSGAVPARARHRACRGADRRRRAGRARDGARAKGCATTCS